MTHPACRRKNGVDAAVAVFHYNDLLKKMIKDIKYRFAVSILSELEQSIDPSKLEQLSFFRRSKAQLYLHPIPLHPDRQRIRGFNQARLLADFFGKLLAIPLCNVMTRTKNTLPQAQLKKGGLRFGNVRGAFEVENSLVVEGKRFILVDDVVTTGATVKEAAKALKKSGAQKVYVLSLARG